MGAKLVSVPGFRNYRSGLVCPASLLLLWSVTACGHGAARNEEASQAGAFKRGDIVVVERTAAEFFEGRVLGVTDTALKVQTTADGEPVVVSRSDAYRLAAAPKEASPEAPAICNDGPGHWAPCRITSSDGAQIRARLGSGGEISLGSNRAIRPSAVTALNIRKVFESAEARRRFGEAAASAGDPKRPPGWLPEIHEPVIARRGTQWFTAHVVSMLEEGGVRVLFQGSDHPEAVPPNSVVPMPPYPRTVSRGDFALARAKSAAEPWLRVRVEALGPEEAVVIGEDGERQRFEARELVPVVADLGR